MGRLIIVSNRLPIKVIQYPSSLDFKPSVGGLATGISSFFESHQGIWVGWPGVAQEDISEQQTEYIWDKIRQLSCEPVFISKDELEDFYYGFCNKTIWPLFHYFPLHTVYEQKYWNAYKRVNQTFGDAVLKIVKPDDQIWIHDYQLMLLPDLLREKLTHTEIGFFLHIPFPSFELFRLLPWRQKILKGLLGADLIGFHTYDYTRHFLSSVCRILGMEHSMGSMIIENRLVKADAFPMGIDYQRYASAVEDKKVKKNRDAIRKKVGDRKIIVSIDRMDYTKGIIQRLEAFDWFLSQNPEYKEKVTLILLAVHSRTGIQDYMKLRRDLEGLVGRINGEHGTIGWVPVWYLYRAVPFERLIALYNLADVALVTPLRDGMNLIAKEYIATKKDGKGVLILSEMAGAASELGEAVIVNANNKREIVEAIKKALEMPLEEQIERNTLMQTRLSRYNISRWAEDFTSALSHVKQTQQQLSVRKLGTRIRERLYEHYRKSNKRIFLLDYDGTLVSFVDRPDKAIPDKDLLHILNLLTSDDKNTVVIISGRDKQTLSRWFENVNVTLVAEHGAWVKRKNNKWQAAEHLRSDWKDTIRPILQLYTDRTPGSLIEEKDFSLVWHFRRTDPELSYVRVQELKDTLLNMTSNLDIGVYEGSKILEIKNLAISKGYIAEMFIENKNWDFIFSAGDDYTDEDMFAVLPQEAYSIKIGYSISKAKYNLDSARELRLFLNKLID
jgi:trehalose 6-phosphate synthase/phosphatase